MFDMFTKSNLTNPVPSIYTNRDHTNQLCRELSLLSRFYLPSIKRYKS